MSRLCSVLVLLSLSTAWNVSAATAIRSTDDYGTLPATKVVSTGASGIGGVNNYNGSVNVTIPLLSIGGRGEAGYEITLPIQQSWSVQKLVDSQSGAESYVARSSDLHLDYSPGHLKIASVSASPSLCYSASRGRWYDGGPYVTRVIWTAGNGAQTMLLDDFYGGQSQGPADCTSVQSYQPVNRQRNFRSKDGSNLLFVASQDIQDSTGLVNPANSTAGTLTFPNGVKYQIDSTGSVTRIEDRNGNLYPSREHRNKATAVLVLGRASVLAHWRGPVMG